MVRAPHVTTTAGSVDAPRRTVDRLSAWLDAHPRMLFVVPGLLSPLVFLGVGTDIDTGNIGSAANAVIHGDYHASRPPGSLPHEIAVALLDRVGGTVAVNLGTLAIATALLFVLVQVLRDEGVSHRVLMAFALAANPFFMIAATSLVDHLWALAFLVFGIRLRQRAHPVLAGVFFGLAIGTRVASGFLVFAALVAFRGAARSRLATVATTAAVAVACFVPAVITSGRLDDLVGTQLEGHSLLTLAGKSLVKQELFVGLYAAVLALLLLPSLIGNLRVRPWSPTIRFAVIGLISMEFVYWRFPWKLAHLLPAMLCAVLLVGVATRRPAMWLTMLIVAQLAWGFLGVRLLVPDVPNAATTIHFRPAIVAGPLLNDIRCRLDLDDTDPVHDQVDAGLRSEEGWACTNSWWGGGAVPVYASR